MPLFFSGKGTPGTLGPVCYIPDMGTEIATLTDRQEAFAALTAEGIPVGRAAKLAGYLVPRVEGSRLSRSEAVRERVRELRSRKIDRMASEALGVLREIMINKAAPTSDRRQAAVHVLALAGHVPAKEAPQDLANLLKGKKITEYSAAELEAFIEDEKARRASAARPVIDQLPANQPQSGQITIDQPTDITDV